MARGKKRALELLQSHHFFNELIAALRKDGLVGERQNALILYIAGVSRLLSRPLCVFVRGTSSSGKNWLLTHVLRLFPDNAYREITSTSHTAWHYSRNEFVHRIVYIQERNDQSGAVHPLRLLISENRIIRVVTRSVGGRRTTKQYITRGPIAAISTTTKKDIAVDDLTRHISLFIDESEEQTRKINKKYTSQGKGIDKAELAAWRVVQDLLKERAGISITFPKWFNRIADYVPAKSVAVRRYYPALVEACRTVCLIRSFQSHPRLAKKASLEVDFADFAVTSLIFDHAFVESLCRDGDANEITRHDVEIIWKRKKKGVRAKDLAHELNISVDKAYERLRSAEHAGVIRRANKPEQRNVKRFLPIPKTRFIPDPEELFQKLKLETIKFVHPVTGERVVYRTCN